MEEQSATIFTDGASRGNPGRGGWGTVVVIGSEVCELGGAKAHTTNNEMEIRVASRNGQPFISGLWNRARRRRSLIHQSSESTTTEGEAE